MAKNGRNAPTAVQYEASMRRHGTADWTAEDERVRAEYEAYYGPAQPIPRPGEGVFFQPPAEPAPPAAGPNVAAFEGPDNEPDNSPDNAESEQASAAGHPDNSPDDEPVRKPRARRAAAKKAGA